MKITDLELNAGEFCLQIRRLHIKDKIIHGLIGSNGSGKTTLAKVMMGILKPDRGMIDYQGCQPAEMTLMLQRPYLLQRSVYENIIYPLKVRGRVPDQEEIDHWLNEYGLYHKKNQYAKCLSSGERQKLSFIRAAIFQPRFIIMDETFSNLDPDTISLMKEWILWKQQNTPITYLIISHQMNHILQLCEIVHVLDTGRLLESGTTKNVMFHSKNPQTMKYMASYVIRMESEQ